MPSDLEVSCVIPVFNGARYVAQAIQSVLGQSHPVVEIIVVDDGSTDATSEVVQSFGDRVTYLYQSNAGPASARNRGIEAASGQLIALLDSDDLWMPDKTSIQIAQFQARPQLQVCTAQMQNFWSSEVEHEIASLQDGQLTQVQPNLGSSFMARRSFFDAIGLLDPMFKHRDIQELIVRASDRGLETVALSDVLVKRRIHDSNLSRNRADAGDRELLAIARNRMLRRRGASP